MENMETAVIIIARWGRVGRHIEKSRPPPCMLLHACPALLASSMHSQHAAWLALSEPSWQQSQLVRHSNVACSTLQGRHGGGAWLGGGGERGGPLAWLEPASQVHSSSQSVSAKAARHSTSQRGGSQAEGAPGGSQPPPPPLRAAEQQAVAAQLLSKRHL